MKRYLYKAIVKTVGWTIIAGLALVILSNHTAQTQGTNPNLDGPTYPEQIAQKHDCWTGEMPADVDIPGHVVVRYDGEGTAHYRGAKATGEALEQMFDDKDHGIAEVTAFCR